MPSIRENLQMWSAKYEWEKEGEEWSRTWGGSEAQWFGTVFPRIHSFIPTATILEIAPGFGRWTHYLKDYCNKLIVVDLSEGCIEACQQRFAYDSHIFYHVNDGKSLEMIADNSIDFVFSFDSLVHAESDVIQSYIKQLSRKLKANGVGFIHHSNIGAYKEVFSLSKKLPFYLRNALIKSGFIDLTHWRAFTMTARIFEGYCEESDLICIGQELINWRTRRLIDCFSLFTKRTSVWARPNEIVKNPYFMKEASLTKKLSKLYSADHLLSDKVNSLEKFSSL
jgi:2-polyprenyl-3-methyl-5-hydroxy-6-metoxy-1,4-benzoquinol methylase